MPPPARLREPSIIACAERFRVVEQHEPFVKYAVEFLGYDFAVFPQAVV
jgi:hypothetical protein